MVPSGGPADGSRDPTVGTMGSLNDAQPTLFTDDAWIEDNTEWVIQSIERILPYRCDIPCDKNILRAAGKPTDDTTGCEYGCQGRGWLYPEPPDDWVHPTIEAWHLTCHEAWSAMRILEKVTV